MNPIKMRRLPSAHDLPLPARADPGSSGLDLAAAQAGILHPGQSMAIGTGWQIDIPHGFEGQIRPRSGLAARHRVTVLNAPGTIDSSYRGEVKVLLINLGSVPWSWDRGERIAQMVICPVEMAELIEVDELSDTDRGHGGFGSTGA